MLGFATAAVHEEHELMSAIMLLLQLRALTTSTAADAISSPVQAAHPSLLTVTMCAQDLASALSIAVRRPQEHARYNATRRCSTCAAPPMR